ncbi:OmpA family protein [Rhodoferax sp. WC2427]|uniref:OmpA family protein n=1 Tax=Rhodoferax sp. WC2427 TaxID=3234144 RepID=UPI0034659CF8
MDNSKLRLRAWHGGRLGAAVVLGVALAACQTPPPAPVAYTGPTLDIEQTERGVQIVLPVTVLFATGEYTFKTEEAAPYLDRLASLLKNKTTHDVSVEGHTDNVGGLDMNQTLSDNRARALRKALEERGVEPRRIVSAGFAYHRPVASNASDQGRTLNRRVELMVLDEKVETLTQGEPANAFASAFDKLRKMVDEGLIQLPDNR